MALDDLRIIILPGKEVFTVGPRGGAPDGGKAAAIDPHWRIIGRISRRWEERWNYLVESLGCSRIGLADVDAIGRVRELEVVDRSGPENLAQLGYGDAPWLAPLLLNIRVAGIGSPTAIAHGRRPKIPIVAGIFQHQGCFFGDVDITAQAIFTEESRLPKRFCPVDAATIAGRSRSKGRQEISIQDGVPCGTLAPCRNDVDHTGSGAGC